MPFPLAAGSLPFVGELAALFAAGVLVAYLCYRVRLVPILAGVVVGPNALGLVTDLELVQEIAEVGVILLLFSIGVEFSLKEMARLARPIFLGGGVQVGLTIGVVAGAAVALGVPFGASVFTGFLVALSSTAIVLKVLAERAEADTPVGRIALAMLLFQDLIIVVMALLVPILAGEGGTGLEIAWALGKAALVVAAVLIGARRVIPALGADPPHRAVPASRCGDLPRHGVGRLPGGREPRAGRLPRGPARERERLRGARAE